MFAAALAILPLAHKRFFAGRNAIDVLPTLVIASTLARAINGSTAFLPTIAVGSCSASRGVVGGGAIRMVARLVKGTSNALVNAGQVNTAVLQRRDLSPDDIEEACGSRAWSVRTRLGTRHWSATARCRSRGVDHR